MVTISGRRTRFKGILGAENKTRRRGLPGGALVCIDWLGFAPID